jgi:hypothetical protein
MSTVEADVLVPIKLHPEFKTKFVAALRSGDYPQCREALKKDGGYCCLGVAAVVAGYTINESLDIVERPDGSRGTTAGYSALADVGLTREVRGPLVRMNDDGKTFGEIADHIETNL